MSNSFQYLFGPVPSRRLGRSLGVDLIPFKTCTLDCIFCQLGKTPCTTSARKEYIPIHDVLAELDRWKETDGAADHITLAGSGEPTLHLQFDEVFHWARRKANIPSVLLSNGTLFYLPEVRNQAAHADKVKVTLSAWNEASFQHLHRPAPTITFEQLIQGERAFREIYSGELSVEVFIVAGLNSSDEQCRKIAAIVQTLQPDRIDLNTAVRPPAFAETQPVDEARLSQLAELFGEKAKVTASFKSAAPQSIELTEERLLGLIKRHPATADQLAQEFNLSPAKLAPMLEQMVSNGALRMEERESAPYYFCREA